MFMFFVCTILTSCSELKIPEDIRNEPGFKTVGVLSLLDGYATLASTGLTIFENAEIKHSAEHWVINAVIADVIVNEINSETRFHASTIELNTVQRAALLPEQYNPFMGRVSEAQVLTLARSAGVDLLVYVVPDRSYIPANIRPNTSVTIEGYGFLYAFGGRLFAPYLAAVLHVVNVHSGKNISSNALIAARVMKLLKIVPAEEKERIRRELGSPYTDRPSGVDGGPSVAELLEPPHHLPTQFSALEPTTQECLIAMLKKTIARDAPYTLMRSRLISRKVYNSYGLLVRGSNVQPCDDIFLHEKLMEGEGSVRVDEGG